MQYTQENSITKYLSSVCSKDHLIIMPVSNSGYGIGKKDKGCAASVSGFAKNYGKMVVKRMNSCIIKGMLG